ncbi:hypothetical protein [Mycoplasma simbae]|uniref:hypothetical protein n=1 Tax=Mycoplasma simbae TaxID=36744 RepID=UPI000496B602|nr:hypothetical protein [Mycoplasma simbae]
MKYNFRKVSTKEQANIYGGSALSVVTAIAPLVISGVSAIAHIVRMFTSRSGENKIGTSSVKWSNETKEPKVEVTPHYKTIYLSY